ncbi:nucleotidyltransferase family protein [Lampropedia aestuarii]|uniref:nucleotidyltransferase family protein n=1 Tax=Lampropedia aestuarii TaxID=2562762 RepID=UPI00246956D3|nr:nucleotidyltransferase family protein [Lampropedia aestuarii]MDH5858404.1 nucleotidyltransferase family protein [Lampropedia aestuarii]
MHATPLFAQAMVLAAGRGERMRPLTDHTPKPLLQVQGKALLEWHLQALARAGLSQVVINTGWLGAQIPAALGHHYTLPASAAHAAGALTLQYSREDLDFGGGIETAGGISRALPLLCESFWLVAGDVFMPEFAFDDSERARFAASHALAHLWLVPNPAHNQAGDFTIQDGLAYPTAAKNPACANSASSAKRPGLSYTYSTIALLKHSLFAAPWCELPPGNPTGLPAALGPLLFKAAALGRVSASIYTGPWTDVGTPERLAALNRV